MLGGSASPTTSLARSNSPSGNGTVTPASGTTPASMTGSGIEIRGFSATGNLIQGNYLGTDAAGAARLSNVVGVLLNGAPGNTVGGTDPASRNVISGNRLDGVQVLVGPNPPPGKPNAGFSEENPWPLPRFTFVTG